LHLLPHPPPYRQLFQESEEKASSKCKDCISVVEEQICSCCGTVWGRGGFDNDQFKMKEDGEFKECRVGMSKQENREMGGQKRRARDDEDDDGFDGPRKLTSIED
jgi:hypothetical protein